MKAEIKKVNRLFEIAMSEANADGLAAVYTQDGQALPPNAPTISGVENIKNFWQGAIDMGVTSVKLESVELDVVADTAIEIGAFELKAADGGVIDQGKYIVVWKKEDGKYKWHRDIWNSSNTAA